MTPANLVMRTNKAISTTLVTLEARAHNKVLSPFIWLAVCFLLLTGKAIWLFEKAIYVTVDAHTPSERYKWAKICGAVLLFFLVIQISRVGETYREQTAAVIAEQNREQK